MNEIPEGLLLYRTQLRDAIKRDLHHRTRHSRVMQHRSLRLALPTVAAVVAATAAIVFGFRDPGDLAGERHSRGEQCFNSLTALSFVHHSSHPPLLRVADRGRHVTVDHDLDA